MEKITGYYLKSDEMKSRIEYLHILFLLKFTSRKFVDLSSFCILTELRIEYFKFFVLFITLKISIMDAGVVEVIFVNLT